MNGNLARISASDLDVLRADPTTIRTFLAQDPLRLRKDWHALHFLLTGEVGGNTLPLGFVMAGEKIGEDVGYGPARVLVATEVIAIHKALDPLGAKEFAARYDGEAMDEADIYPGGWDEEPEEELEGLCETLNAVKAYVAAAANAGDALLVWVD